MRQQAIPNARKLANVVPIFKGKGSKMSVNNYRPISLTIIFFKIMESLVLQKIFEYLDANNLVSQSQSDFRAGRSTLSQLLQAKAKFVE